MQKMPPKTSRASLRFSPNELAEIDELAKLKGLTRIDLFRDLVRAEIERLSENDLRRDVEKLKHQFEVAEYKRLKNDFYRTSHALTLLMKLAEKSGIDLDKVDKQEDIDDATRYTNHLNPDAHIKDPT
jgi:hypothetical protein